MLQLIFILVNFCFSFVLNSLEYITIHCPCVLFASSVSSWTLLQWWFYYSFKIIPSLKTWLKHAYLHRSVDVKFIFNSARLGLFSSANIPPNSRCRPSSCLLAVLTMWRVRVSAILVFTTKTTQLRHQVFSVNGALTCRGLHFDVISSLNSNFYQIWSSVTGYDELCECI